MLGSAFGKTESWYILGGREINGEKSAIYLGFREGVTEEIWKELFLKQDIQGMLSNLHRFEVNPGDAFIIYGGVPHAIGSGCFLMEVQEPTDYTMRVEKVTPGRTDHQRRTDSPGHWNRKNAEMFSLLWLFVRRSQPEVENYAGSYPCIEGVYP